MLHFRPGSGFPNISNHRHCSVAFSCLSAVHGMPACSTLQFSFPPVETQESHARGSVSSLDLIHNRCKFSATDFSQDEIHATVSRRRQFSSLVIQRFVFICRFLCFALILEAVVFLFTTLNVSFSIALLLISQ